MFYNLIFMQKINYQNTISMQNYALFGNLVSAFILPTAFMICHKQ